MDMMDQKDEASILVALSGCIDILGLIVECSFGKGRQYLIESLFIRLRHLASFFSRDSSPLIHYKDSLSEEELSIIDRLVNVRHAAAHPETNQHWFNEYLMISGVWNFKNEDVEIQYGANKLFLVKEVVPIYKKLRELFSQAPELSRLAQHPHWKHQEQELVDIEQELVGLLQEPEQLLRMEPGARPGKPVQTLPTSG